MKLNKDKRTYLIIGLCAILVVMAVGYAAFASQLTINGTAETTSTWNVVISDITVLDTHEAQVGGVVDKTGSPSYTALTATFDVELQSPGDYRIYKIKVNNLGSLNAKLTNISSPTNANNDIKFYVNEDENGNAISDSDPSARMLKADNSGSSILNANDNATGGLDEGYVYVKVLYRSYPSQVSPTGDAATATETITLDFVQTSEEASAPTPAPTSSSYYVFDTTQHRIGDSYTPTSAEGVWPAGRTVALKYVLDGSGNIAEAYACAKFEGLTDPVCLRGGSAEAYADNPGIITSVQARQDYSEFESEGGGSCSSDASDSYCDAAGLSVYAGDYGTVRADDDSAGNLYCRVNDNGIALCYE